MIDYTRSPGVPVGKPKHERGKPRKATTSNLSAKEDKRLKERSNGVCERCDRARATERAHIVRRRHHTTRPTAEDYAHLCAPCHLFADGSREGREWLLQFQRNLKREGA